MTKPIQGPMTTASAVADGGTTETVVLTLSGVTMTQPGDRIVLQGEVNISPGTSGTAVVVRVRRGTTTAGTLVGNAITHTLANPNSGTISIEVTDSPGESAGLSYVITVQVTGAAANGTVNYAALAPTVF